jgi:hypothetical protein
MSLPALHIPGLPVGFPLPPSTPSIGAIVPESGPVSGGNAVLILGSGLANATSVTFGKIPATILFQDPFGLVIIVAAPALAAGAVPVVVTNAGGTSAPATYTYLPPAGPVVFTMTPTSGPAVGGTPFTIIGSNLTSASVTFNGIPATSVVVDASGTILTAVTPPGAAGNATVVVTTPAGSTTVAGGFTYTGALPPTATSITPLVGPAAGGTPFTIIGSNLTGASVSFGGTPATSIVVNVDGTVLTGVTPAHVAGTLVVTVTTPGGTVTVPGAFTFV